MANSAKVRSSSNVFNYATYPPAATFQPIHSCTNKIIRMQFLRSISRLLKDQNSPDFVQYPNQYCFNAWKISKRNLSMLSLCGWSGRFWNCLDGLLWRPVGLFPIVASGAGQDIKQTVQICNSPVSTNITNITKISKCRQYKSAIPLSAVTNTSAVVQYSTVQYIKYNQAISTKTYFFCILCWS